jgi:integral membrane protein
VTSGRPSPGAVAADVRPALRRYQVLAYVVGVLLIVVCSGPILRWLAEDGSTLWQVGDFIQNRVSPVHGFLYIVFLVCAAVLSRLAAWPLSFTVVTMLLGTVPILSFVAERRATARTLQTAGVAAGG